MMCLVFTMIFLDKNYHLDQGLYTLDALQKEFNRVTQETLHNSNNISMSADTSTSHVYLTIPQMHGLFFINLLGSYNVMKLLGYTPNDERTGINDLPSGEPGLYKYFEGNKKHNSIIFKMY